MKGAAGGGRHRAELGLGVVRRREASFGARDEGRFSGGFCSGEGGRAASRSGRRSASRTKEGKRAEGDAPPLERAVPVRHPALHALGRDGLERLTDCAGNGRRPDGDELDVDCCRRRLGDGHLRGKRGGG